MFETQSEDVTDEFLAEGEQESHESEVKRAKENILLRLGSSKDSPPKLYGSGSNLAIPSLFQKKEVKHGLKYITLGHVIKNRVVESKYEITPAGVGSLSADEEIFISIFQKLQPCDKDKWFNHVLTTLANYEVGKEHKLKEQADAAAEDKIKKKMTAKELRALLELAEREEEVQPTSGGFNTLKRLAGAVASTAQGFAEANLAKEAKLG
ncbi:hypothetical protein CYMTET_37200 [Cymbomonas tetramitiformis]|uniref:Uncharacterized protein n=1 Tax=Cymbomonas tetramitiformis TaxID=36881 RepID=A0AAE0EXL5_9CHLO|nr:hypothetical protein CYMTET_46448 [Cymbomonas tetramitiformis]KAK3244618.1 hypothetical protein CYMTET_45774 [Cymbomonas tetramitiformis]KAK3244620.1 hypothetical protein CYMTET_45773 [Cymbomonas tetramitiformis]KAK3253554.1 hypothetical protein CYMTET_37200 [Cymbomonas tetramitiformis]